MSLFGRPRFTRRQLAPVSDFEWKFYRNEVFDGFSIGSNDLTQLTLGLDRDSEIVAHLFDERNPAVKKLIADVIRRARSCGRKVGICGQAPSDYPEFAEFLVECGIDSISLNPDTVMRTSQLILNAERRIQLQSSSRSDNSEEVKKRVDSNTPTLTRTKRV